MDTVLSILHVVTSVFIIGPMAILPMAALRAIRAQQSGAAMAIAKSTTILSYASLLVVVFGFGVMGMADPRYNLSITTSWVMASLILYVVALLLNIAVVLPKLRLAAQHLRDGSETIGGTNYKTIAVSPGVVSLLLVAIVVLMVWKP